MRLARTRQIAEWEKPGFPMYLEFEHQHSSSHRGGHGRDHLRGIDVMIKRARSSNQIRALINEWRLLHELPDGFFAQPVEFRKLPDGSAYLTTHWLSAEPLDAYCAAADDGQLITIIRKALDGLAILHRAGFVHGDVRPQNILVASMPAAHDVRWMDLEHAAAIADPAARRSYVAGWNAPILERGHGQSPATDLYAFGLVIAHIVDRRRRNGQESVALLGEFARALLKQDPLEPIGDALEASARLDRMLEMHLCSSVPARVPIAAWHVVNRRARAEWTSRWPQWSRSGRQTLVSVHGPAGSGKTTFLRAAAAELALEGCQVLDLIDWYDKNERKRPNSGWGARLLAYIQSQEPDPTLLIISDEAWREFYAAHSDHLVAPVVVILEGRQPLHSGAPAGWNHHEWTFTPFSDREWYEWVIASI